MKKIGARFKAARKAAGYTQQEAATHIQVSRQSLSAWERGANLPDVLELRDVATLYGVSADYLIFGGEMMPTRGGLMDMLKAEKLAGEREGEPSVP